MNVLIVFVLCTVLLAVGAEQSWRCIDGRCPNHYNCVNDKCIPVDYSKLGPCDDIYSVCPGSVKLCDPQNYLSKSIRAVCPHTCKVCESNPALSHFLTEKMY